MNLSELSIRNPVFVNMTVIVLVVVGIWSYITLRREMFPIIPQDRVKVEAIYPGVSPEEMEQVITAPIEAELVGLDDVKEMTSITSEGRMVILLELDPGADVHELVRRTESRIDKVENYPQDAEKPEVEELEYNWPVSSVTISGNATERELHDLAEDLQELFVEIEGVASVVKVGVREREVWVEVNREQLYAAGLNLMDVAGAIARHNVDTPAGNLKTERQEFIVRTQNEFDSMESIERAIVRSTGAGRDIQVGELAVAMDTFQDIDLRTRGNGRPGVMLNILKKGTGNTLQIKDEIDRILDSYRKSVGDQYQFATVLDFSYAIRERLAVVEGNGVMGLILVGLLLYLFLDGRMAVMVGLGVPFAFFGTFILMRFFGYSLNMVSMFGMILVLGMLVDDAIIIAENVYRHIERGVSPVAAAVRGTSEVTIPVISAVSTTVAAFLPLFLMEGLIGAFLKEIPMIVCFALCVSLYEALVILPSHMADFARLPHGRDRLAVRIFRALTGRRKRKVEAVRHRQPPRRWYQGLMVVYSRILRLALRYRYWFVFFWLSLAGVAVVLAVWVIPFVLIHVEDSQFLRIQIEMPVGTRMEETQRIVERLERKALELPDREIESILSNVGYLVDEFGNITIGTHVAEVYVDFVQSTQRDRLGWEIMQDLRARVGEVPEAVSVDYEEDKGGPPVGKAVSMTVRGDDFRILREIAADVKASLATIDGVFDIADNFKEGKQELRVRLDSQRMRSLGLDAEQVGQEIRAAFYGLKATKYHDGDDELDLLVKFQHQYRNEMEDVQHMRFRNLAGDLVPFSNFAVLETSPGYSQIMRLDNERSITINADVDPDIITSTKVNEMLMARYGHISETHPGYSFLYRGENEDTERSIHSFKLAFILSLLLIYFILASTFKSYVYPIVVLFTVPFSFIGVVLGFTIMNVPIGLMALIGLVALNGIVVNDAIVLVEFINYGRERGVGRWHSVMHAGRTRMRPIILTSVTTIAGLAPIAFFASGTTQFLAPMALAVIWGLVFATVLTLITIPCVFSIVDDIKLILGISIRPVMHTATETHDLHPIHAGRL